MSFAAHKSNSKPTGQRSINSGEPIIWDLWTQRRSMKLDSISITPGKTTNTTSPQSGNKNIYSSICFAQSQILHLIIITTPMKPTYKRPRDEGKR